MYGNVVSAGVFHTSQHQDLRAARGHFEHLLEGDGLEASGVGNDARVGGVDTVDVGVDLAHVGFESRGQRDGRRIRSATAERRDVLGVLRDSLETCDQHDLALV